MRQLQWCLALCLMFIGAAVCCAEGTPKYEARKAADYTVRGGIGNTLAKLNAGLPVNVAYLGGSITETGDGWRPQTTAWLAKNWPNAKVHEINAAIGATGSEIGVYRMERDVLRYKPDLLFVEFAVNDGGYTPENIWKQFEGIIRKTWRANPKTDIVFCYTVVSGTIDTYRQGQYPATANAMEQIADFYDIPSISFGQRVVKLLDEKKLLFKADTAPEGIILFSKDGTHPIASGSALYTQDVARAFAAMANIAGTDHAPKLAKTFITGNFENVSMVSITPNMLKGKWRKVLPGERYAFFIRWLDDIWLTETPGSRIEFKFKGEHVKLYDIPSTDGGQIRVMVDGKEVGVFSRYHPYWWSRLDAFDVAINLDPNKVHTVVVELDKIAPNRSRRDAAVDPKVYEGLRYRVGKIMLNGTIIE